MAAPKASVLTENVQGTALGAQQLLNRALQPGLGTEGSVQTYTQGANMYDEYVETFEYDGHRKAANEMAKVFPGDRSKVRILDIAAGTGMAAEELKKLGFTNIDALDPSPGMLEAAKPKGLYQKFICEYISDKRLPIPDNDYDGIIIAGGMGENHIPTVAVHEMIRLVKPGGYIVNVTRQEHMVNCSDYAGRLEKLMAQLEQEGKWKQIGRLTDFNFFRGKPGLCFVHRVC